MSDELLIVAIRLPEGAHPDIRSEIEKVVEASGSDRQASFAAGPVDHYAEMDPKLIALGKLERLAQATRATDESRGSLRHALHVLGLADDRLLEDDGKER